MNNITSFSNKERRVRMPKLNKVSKVKIPKIKMFSRSIRLFFRYFVTLLSGQIILLIAAMFLLRPVVSNIFRIALKASGYSYVTVNNIIPFLLNPISISIVFILLLIIGIFLLYNTYYFIIFFTYIQNKSKPKLFKTYILALYHLLRSLHPKNIKTLPQIYLLVGLWNIPLIYFVLNKIRFFRFFVEESNKKIPFIVTMLIGLAILALILCRNRFFIFSSILTKNVTYKKGVNKSVEISKSKGIKTILYFLFWNMGISVVILAVYAFIMCLTILFVTGLADKTLAIATFISLNDRINGYLFLIFYTISTAGNIALITNMYRTYSQDKDNLLETINNVIYVSKYSYKRNVAIVVVALAVINFYFFFIDIRHGSPLDYMNLDKIQVTSHRGFSHDVPENTMPAIVKAIEEQADYIEVDVRVTKDGELVLLHDNNLNRTTGVNKRIWNITYEEIAELDAGSWLGAEFGGIKIPTLREIFELSKGKVMLNLDLKYRSEDEGLAEKVVTLMEEYGMEWQCVVTSTSLKCLEQIKELNSDIRTGYITYQIYSGLYENNSVDFFSMKYNLVSKGVVRQVHKNGKEIHVWTVNSKTELERLERIGVDNIITDNPAYAKQVLYQESEMFFITLLKIIME